MKKELFIGVFITLIIGGIIYFQVVKSTQKQDIPQETQSPTKKIASQTQVSPSGASYSLDEISKHNQKSDCWMIIYNKVYNLTDYLDSHSGGLGMVNFCGKDGTQAFETKGLKNKPHSPKARKILKNYYIGDLQK